MLIRFILMAAVAAGLGNAQPPTSEPGPASKDIRETPRGALLGYLDACRDGDYRRAASFLNIRREQRRSGTPEELALKLKQVLDRKLSQDPNSISNVPEGDLTDGLESNLDSFGIIKHGDRNVDLLLERVQIPEIGQIWLISSNTISLIPLVHEGIGINPVERYLPDWMSRRKVFDTALWQWFALVLLTVIALLLGNVIARTIIRSLRPLVRRTQTGLDDLLIESIRLPMQVLIALAAYRAGTCG